ncbi:hypothetical protein BC830DRAFT_1118858 [Chytriomyces sp. MP71]|nr:hypothetical protein BC830DRAFT_1118858 [Chytriomyces sp. MP71]
MAGTSSPACFTLDATSICGPLFAGFPVNAVTSFLSNAQAIADVITQTYTASTYTDADHGCMSGDALNTRITSLRYQTALLCSRLVFDAVVSGGVGCQATGQMAALFPRGPLMCPTECSVAVDTYSSLVNDPKACMPTASNLARINAKSSSCVAQQQALIDAGYTTCVVALPSEAPLCGFSSQDAFNIYCAGAHNMTPCCFSQMTTVPFVAKAAVYPAMMGANSSLPSPSNNNSTAWSNPIVLAGITVGAVLIVGAMGYMTVRVARSGSSKSPSISVPKGVSMKKGTPPSSPLPMTTADLEGKTTAITATPFSRQETAKISPAATVTRLSPAATLSRPGTGPCNSPRPTPQRSRQSTQPRLHITVSRSTTVDRPERVNTARSNRSNHHLASTAKSIQISVRNSSILDIAHDASKHLPIGKGDTLLSGGVLMRGVHPYVANMRDEISIIPEQELLVLKSYDDGWGHGVDLNTMQHGAFPLACVVVVSRDKVLRESAISVATNLPGDGEARRRSSFVTEEEWAGVQGKRSRANSGVSSLYSAYGRLSYPPSPVQDSGKTEPEGVLHRVLYSYEAIQSDELNLVAGETVFVVQEFDDGWALGESPATGQRGAVPMACLTTGLDTEPNTDSQIGSYVSRERLSKRVSSFWSLYSRS